MLDLVIENARICDGTGRPSAMGTLGATNGVITYLGSDKGLAARQRIDAGGLVLAPGFIDPHTHYDAQIAWDSLLTSSPWHGVTTVVMGNCGVGVAPVLPQTRDILMHDLVNVEAIPYDVMQAGIDWRWESYGEYLDAIGRTGLGVNVAGLVAFTPLRHYVMGEDSFERAARPDRSPGCGSSCARPWKPGPSASARPPRAITSATAAVRSPAGTRAPMSWPGCATRCATWAAAPSRSPSTPPAAT